MKSTTARHIVSKKHASTTRLTTTALSSALLLASSAIGTAQDPAASRALNTVKIDAEATETYNADPVSSPKFSQPPPDTPQTIQAITSQVFSQQGATTLTAALRNS